MVDPVPLRPQAEVVGGFITFRLGGDEQSVRVLSMAANRAWTAHLARTVRDALGKLGPLETADQVAEALASQAEVMMDLLIAYDDASGAAVLPDRDWIDTHATDTECYEAMKRVTAAAYPFGPDLLKIAPELIPTLIDSLTQRVAGAMVAMALSRSTSSSPPSTDSEPPPTSSPDSPTSSSPPTSKRPGSGTGRKRSRS